MIVWLVALRFEYQAFRARRHILEVHHEAISAGAMFVLELALIVVCDGAAQQRMCCNSHIIAARQSYLQS